MAKSEKKKARVLRWRGRLADASRSLRVLTGVMLAITSFTLTFVQLGFMNIAPVGEVSTYIVTLLLPIALGSLLLGTAWGTALGFFSGAVLLAHSIGLPLNYYEMAFVNPVSSVVMMGVSGFLLAVLFAFSLRNDPPLIRRVIYTTLICAFVSWLYSSVFLAGVGLSLVANVAHNMPVSGATEKELVAFAKAEAANVAMRLGDIGWQMLIDALLMVVACMLGDWLARRAAASETRASLRGVFAAGLSAVFLASFMITSVVSFVFITADCVQHSEASMEGELVYVDKQLQGYQDRIEAVFDLIASSALESDDSLEGTLGKLLDTASLSRVLDGYDVNDDGTIVVLDAEWTVVQSNDASLKGGDNVDTPNNREIMSAITDSLRTGRIQRVAYDDFGYSSNDLDDFFESVGRTDIGYLLASKPGDYTLVMAMPSKRVFAGRESVMLWTLLTSFVLLIAVFAMMSLMLNRVVLRRMADANEALGRITDGDLNARVDTPGINEFEELSAGINDTVVALKGWIAEAETRMNAELATAKAIQESALPRVFPPFPDIMRFDVYAMMHAAREVGGDFFDLFLIGDDSDSNSGRLGFVVADVSGKGVPAALFMMNAKTLVRGYMESEMELGEAIENANRQLYAGNDTGMFVTLFAGVLDYGTGHVDFVNAGHNPPLLWQAGSWRWLKEKSGLPLGLFDGLPYRAHSVDCSIGDQFLLYTDGVTEAMNENEELFGEDRLRDVAEKNYFAHPRALVNSVRHAVSGFVGEAERSDDITMLALEYGVPPEVTASLVVPARLDELTTVNEFIHTELDRRLCPKRTQNQLDIAVEELFVNVAHYAYPDATPESPGSVRVSYTYSAEPPSVTIDIIDDGVPYDPLAKPDAVTPLEIEDVPIGGLGILMAKRSVDEMRYERVDGSNVVTIVKRW